MTVLTRRRHHKELARDGLPQIKHDPRNIGLELGHTHPADQRVVRTDAGCQLVQSATSGETLQIDDQAHRVFERHRLEGHRGVGLEGETRAFGRWPETHCLDLPERQRQWRDQQQGASQQRAQPARA